MSSHLPPALRPIVLRCVCTRWCFDFFKRYSLKIFSKYKNSRSLPFSHMQLAMNLNRFSLIHHRSAVILTHPWDVSDVRPLPTIVNVLSSLPPKTAHLWTSKCNYRAIFRIQREFFSCALSFYLTFPVAACSGLTWTRQMVRGRKIKLNLISGFCFVFCGACDTLLARETSFMLKMLLSAKSRKI